MFSEAKFQYRYGVLLALVVLLGLGACSVGLKETPITSENQAQILEQARKELTMEEAQLLKGYLERTYPGLGPEELPVGRTLGEMIADQRALAGSTAQGMRAESAVEGTPSEEPPVQGSAAAEPAARPSEPTPTPAKRTPPRTPEPRAEEPSSTTESAAVEKPQAPPEPDAPPAPQAPATVSVPSGTRLQIRLASSISTRTNQSGDRFEAALDKDLVIGENVVAPEGSRVTGTLLDVQKSGKVKGKATLSMTINQIEVDGEAYALRANTLSFEASGTAKQDAKKIGIATGVGAVIGAIAGGGKGAAIGTAVGAGAGTGVVLATAGEQVEFGVETPFEFSLQSAVEMKIAGS